MTNENVRNCHTSYVPEHDIALVRSGLWGKLVEDLCHFFTLVAGPLKNRASPADCGILLFDARRASLGDPRGQQLLHGKRNEVAVVK